MIVFFVIYYITNTFIPVAEKGNKMEAAAYTCGKLQVGKPVLMVTLDGE